MSRFHVPRPVLFMLASALLALPASAAELSVRLPTEAGATGSSNHYRLDLGGAAARISGDGLEPVERPLAGLGRITVAGSPGDDTLTVRLAELPQLEIDYDGAAGFDTIRIEGSARLDSVEYTPGPGNYEGVLRYRHGGRSLTIRFDGLEPIQDSVSATTLTVNATNAANSITYSEGTTSSAWGLVTVDAFETIEFQNKTGLVLNGLDGADTFHVTNPSLPTGMDRLTANGALGPDVFNVQEAPSGMFFLTLNGGDGSDTFNISSDAPANTGSLDSILSRVTVNGGAHDAGTTTLTIKGVGNALDSGDVLNMSDAGDTDASNYDINLAGEQRLDREGFFGLVEYDTVETFNLWTGTAAGVIDLWDSPDSINLSITSGGADDFVRVTDSGVAANIVVNTGGGVDNPQVEGSGVGAFLQVNLGPGADTLRIDDTGASSRVEINGEAGTDTISVIATTATSLVNLNGGANSDIFDVTPLSSFGSENLDDIQGNVCVNGDAHDAGTTTLTIRGTGNTLDSGDVLNIRDRLNFNAQTYGLGPTTLTRTGAATIEYGTIETLSFETAQGAMDLDIDSTAASVNTTVTLSGAGSETDDVDVTVTGAASNTVIHLKNGADLVDIASTGVGAFTQVKGDFDGYATSLLSTGGGGSHTELTSSVGVDTFDIQTTAATSVVNIVSGLNSDTVNISSDAPANTGTLDGILGDVFLNLESCDPGSTTLTIKGVSNTSETCNILNLSDAGDPDAATYTINFSVIARSGTATIDAQATTLNLWTGAGPADVDVVGVLGNLNLTTQDSVDDIDIARLGASANTVIDTQEGNDTVDIDLPLNGSNNAFAQINAGAGDDALTVVATGTGTRLELNGESGTDTLNVRKVDATSLVNISGGDNSDTIIVTSDAPFLTGSLADLDGQVCVNGDAHDGGSFSVTIDGETNTLDSGDSLTIYDGGDTSSVRDYVLTPSTFNRVGSHEGQVDYATIETLEISGGTGASNFDIQNTAAAVNTFVNGQNSDDEIHIADTGADSNVLVTTLGGNDSVTVDDMGPDGGDVNALGAFLTITDSAGVDALDYTDGSATLVTTGPTSGFIFPPQAQRMQYSGFETAGVGSDWGDAPDPDYPSLSANNGARHGGAGALRLGAAWDAETDGQPNSAADGDGADEDGVVFNSLFVAPAEAGGNVDVTLSGTGRIDAWVDWNQDGDWLDQGEQVLTNRFRTAGTWTESISNFFEVLPGDTYARFRLSSAGGLSPTGHAPDGEVEDYAVTVKPLDTVFLVQNQESETVTYWACDRIDVGNRFNDPGFFFHVLTGADVTLHAANEVRFYSDVVVEEGAELKVIVGPVPGCP